MIYLENHSWAKTESISITASCYLKVEHILDYLYCTILAVTVLFDGDGVASCSNVFWFHSCLTVLCRYRILLCSREKKTVQQSVMNPVKSRMRRTFLIVLKMTLIRSSLNSIRTGRLNEPRIAVSCPDWRCQRHRANDDHSLVLKFYTVLTVTCRTHVTTSCIDVVCDTALCVLNVPRLVKARLTFGCISWSEATWTGNVMSRISNINIWFLLVLFHSVVVENRAGARTHPCRTCTHVAMTHQALWCRIAFSL